VAHPDLCSERAKGFHGSSRFDRDSRRLEGAGYLSADSARNPLLHDWTRVVVRNCDGTAFTSSADDPLPRQRAGDPGRAP